MNFNFEEWISKFPKEEVNEELIRFGKSQEKYYNEKVIDVYKELSKKAITIIEKLGIKLENKIYTEYEFDVLEGQISEYQTHEGITEEELSYVKSLDGTGVNSEEINDLLNEIYTISEKHHF